tara:strand:- start:1443 stop:2171 length:729 start_codon:yes stop_codon:yes gene_type:complete
MSVAIVCPTYNESENIPALVERVFALKDIDPRLIIVDDSSPDGTATVVNKIIVESDLPITLIERDGKLGLGTAYIEGFSAALDTSCEFVVQMDADLSHPPELIPVLIQALSKSDVAVASRYIEDGSNKEEWSYFRKLVSRGGDLYVRKMLGIDVTDPKSGFKAIRSEVLRTIPIKNINSVGFIFQSELLYLAKKCGFSITEIPYEFAKRVTGDSKMDKSIIIEGLWRPLQMRWKYNRFRRTK